MPALLFNSDSSKSLAELLSAFPDEYRNVMLTNDKGTFGSNYDEDGDMKPVVNALVFIDRA